PNRTKQDIARFGRCSFPRLTQAREEGAEEGEVLQPLVAAGGVGEGDEEVGALPPVLVEEELPSVGRHVAVEVPLLDGHHAVLHGRQLLAEPPLTLRVAAPVGRRPLLYHPRESGGDVRRRLDLLDVFRPCLVGRLGAVADGAAPLPVVVPNTSTRAAPAGRARERHGRRVRRRPFGSPTLGAEFAN